MLWEILKLTSFVSEINFVLLPAVKNTSYPLKSVNFTYTKTANDMQWINKQRDESVKLRIRNNEIQLQDPNRFRKTLYLMDAQVTGLIWTAQNLIYCK